MALAQTPSSLMQKAKAQNKVDGDEVVSSNGLYTITRSGKLLFTPHPGQYMTWLSTARFVLMLAGTQGGKTSFGPWWLYREIQKGGEGDYLAVTTNFDLFSLKMLPEMRLVFEDIFRIGRYWPGSRIIEIRDPKTRKFRAKRADDRMYARIILRSINAPSGLESATAKAAWLDELGQNEWDISDWEAIQRRLSLAQGRVLGTSTIYNSGWLKQDWYDKFLSGDKDYDVIQFASLINPSFPKEEFERQKASKPEWKFKMFYEGEFSNPPGIIYSDYEFVQPFTIPPHWPRVIGIDFGGANMCTLHLAKDIDNFNGPWYAYFETLDGHKSTRDYAFNLQKTLAGIEYVQFVGGAPGEVQQRIDWGIYGIDIQQPITDDVEVGISNVIEMFRTKKLKIFSNMRGLKHELATYGREIGPDNVVSNKIENKGKFHRLDALRYAVTVALHANQGTFVV